MSHTIKDEDNHMLSFKENISLEDFGKALKWYNNLVKMFAGRDALYSEFTKWLIDNEFVNVEPSLKDVEKAMEEKTNA